MTLFSQVALVVAGCCVLASLPADGAPADPAFDPVKDDPNLPRVLLIGDSISIGYTVPVRFSVGSAAVCIHTHEQDVKDLTVTLDAPKSAKGYWYSP